METKELYPSLIQMVIQAENISWGRFNNFLMFNSILVLAWSTIFAANLTSLQQSRTVVLVAFCILGAMSGVWWAALGSRGRAFLDVYLDVAQDFENDKTAWVNDSTNDKFKIAKLTRDFRDSTCYSWAGSRVLLIGGPLSFTGLYFILFFVSLKC